MQMGGGDAGELTSADGHGVLHEAAGETPQLTKRLSLGSSHWEVKQRTLGTGFRPERKAEPQVQGPRETEQTELILKSKASLSGQTH